MKSHIAALVLVLFSLSSRAEQVGEVDTVFKLIGPDHKIVVEVFDDPKVNGVSCFLSRAMTGGIGRGAA